MNILKESKEKLPIDFITQFISQGWEEVGNLKASCDAIKKEFKDTKVIEDILQGLSDSYLIAIGQMEAYLNKKDYVELPKEEKLKEALTESNEEDAELLKNKMLNVDNYKTGNKLAKLLRQNKNVTIERPKIAKDGTIVLSNKILQGWE